MYFGKSVRWYALIVAEQKDGFGLLRDSHLYFEGVCSVEIEIEAKSYNCLNRWWTFQYLKRSCLQEMRRNLSHILSMVKGLGEQGANIPQIYIFLLSGYAINFWDRWGGWGGIIRMWMDWHCKYFTCACADGSFWFAHYHIKPLFVILLN